MVNLVATTSTGDWLFRLAGPVAGAAFLWMARKVGKAVDEINTNVQSIPGIRTDVQALQTDVRDLTAGMEEGRQILHSRLDEVDGRLDDRNLLSEHVGTIAHLMEQRISQGPPRRAEDPPDTYHVAERAP